MAEDKNRSPKESERGKRASFDPATGEVHGSGSGAGGGNDVEDYDDDPMAGGGSAAGGPIPAEQARERPGDHDQNDRR